MRATAWASLAFAVLLALLAALPVNAAPAQKPNVLIILADDLGYGDVSCYNDRAKVPTPMRIKWDGPNPSLRLEVCGLEGEVVISRDIPFSELRPK